MGGTFSTIQLVGDSLAEARLQGFQNGWKGITGNPAKLGLGLASVFFDVSMHNVFNNIGMFSRGANISCSCLILIQVIFIVQHYILYKHPVSNDNKNNWQEHQSTLLEDSDYDAPLLPDSDEPEVIVFV